MFRPCYQGSKLVLSTVYTYSRSEVPVVKESQPLTQKYRCVNRFTDLSIHHSFSIYHRFIECPMPLASSMSRVGQTGTTSSLSNTWTSKMVMVIVNCQHKIFALYSIDLWSVGYHNYYYAMHYSRIAFSKNGEETITPKVSWCFATFNTLPCDTCDTCNFFSHPSHFIQENYSYSVLPWSVFEVSYH